MGSWSLMRKWFGIEPVETGPTEEEMLAGLSPEERKEIPTVDELKEERIRRAAVAGILVAARRARELPEITRKIEVLKAELRRIRSSRLVSQMQLEIDKLEREYCFLSSAQDLFFKGKTSYSEEIQDRIWQTETREYHRISLVVQDDFVWHPNPNYDPDADYRGPNKPEPGWKIPTSLTWEEWFNPAQERKRLIREAYEKHRKSEHEMAERRLQEADYRRLSPEARRILEGK